MTPDALRSAGERLYGPRWIVPLARALAVNIRTVERWASGHTPTPPWLASKLDALAQIQDRPDD